LATPTFEFRPLGGVFAIAFLFAAWVSCEGGEKKGDGHDFIPSQIFVTTGQTKLLGILSVANKPTKNLGYFRRI